MILLLLLKEMEAVMVVMEDQMPKLISLPKLIEQLTSNPWLITVSGFQSLVDTLESIKHGNAEKDAQAIGEPSTQTPPAAKIIDPNGIAVLSIQGPLANRPSDFEKIYFGYTDYLDIQRDSARAVAEGARAIMYLMDSPGGGVRGCPETAEYIEGLSVPTGAYVDGRMCSAAYWLGSATGHITGSQTADVGSIGVILPWIDKTKLWDEFGVKWQPITNEGATLKGTGGGPSLNEEQLGYLQEQVDHVGKEFHAFVKSHRDGLKTAKVFKAGTYFGKQALDVGLVDKIGTYAEAYDELLTRVKSKREQAVVPGHAANDKQTGKIMDKEQLKKEHPELFAELAKEQSSNAALAERNRIAALNKLNYSPECKKLVDNAIEKGLQASDIAVEIAELLAGDVDLANTRAGIRAGAAGAGRVASHDPNQGDELTGDKAVAARLVALTKKRYKLN